MNDTDYGLPVNYSDPGDLPETVAATDDILNKMIGEMVAAMQITATLLLMPDEVARYLRRSASSNRGRTVRPIGAWSPRTVAAVARLLDAIHLESMTDPDSHEAVRSVVVKEREDAKAARMASEGGLAS